MRGFVPINENCRQVCTIWRSHLTRPWLVRQIQFLIAKNKGLCEGCVSIWADDVNRSPCRKTVINALNFIGKTASIEILKELLEIWHGGISESVSPFQNAANYAKSEIIQVFLDLPDQYQLDLSIEGLNGLFAACFSGHFDIVKQILEHPRGQHIDNCQRSRRNIF